MLDDARRAVLIDMAYEIGGAGLAGFHDMLAAVRIGDWQTAAAELRDSKLYRQVKHREDENCAILLTGALPTGVTCVDDLIKRHEGCVLTAKPDAEGKWEIGWGHDIDAPGAAQPIPTWTQDRADAQIVQDVALATSRAAADLGAAYW